MENIGQALDSVQEELLTHYEKDSKDLKDQIEHWKLNRRENALLFLARKNGVTRIGMKPVPPMSVSQQRAKQAIEQQLLCESLLSSDYGRESWSLQDTSRETLLTDPELCFKKHGQSVEVKFDNDPTNVSSYVLWKDIYHQTDSDTWRKTHGMVDQHGIYYKDEHGLKVYYVSFRDEAAKYGTTGMYEVNKLTSNVPTSAGARDASPPGPTSGPSTPRQKPQTPKRRQRPIRLTTPRSRHRLGGRREGESLTPPNPEEVGRLTQTTPKGPGSRLGRLLLDARDPPILILKGEANPLKCLRYRLKAKHSSFFLRVSTTFYWTSATGPDRWGKARMIVTFKSEEQRASFLSQVSLPKSVRYYKGSLDEL